MKLEYQTKPETRILGSIGKGLGFGFGFGENRETPIIFGTLLVGKIKDFEFRFFRQTEN